MKQTILAIIVLFNLLGCTPISFAKTIPDQDAVLSIIGEAENQGPHGMLSVACAIKNRGTLKGVYGLKNPRVTKKLYNNKTFRIAKQSWQEAQIPENCSFIKGADHWENIKTYGTPSWTKNMKRVYEHKDHVFYSSK